MENSIELPTASEHTFHRQINNSSSSASIFNVTSPNSLPDNFNATNENNTQATRQPMRKMQIPILIENNDHIMLLDCCDIL